MICHKISAKSCSEIVDDDKFDALLNETLLTNPTDNTDLESVLS